MAGGVRAGGLSALGYSMYALHVDILARIIKCENLLLQ